MDPQKLKSSKGMYLRKLRILPVRPPMAVESYMLPKGYVNARGKEHCQSSLNTRLKMHLIEIMGEIELSECNLESRTAAKDSFTSHN